MKNKVSKSSQKDTKAYNVFADSILVLLFLLIVFSFCSCAESKTQSKTTNITVEESIIEYQWDGPEIIVTAEAIPSPGVVAQK